jgi:hypothetical protein
MQYESENPLSVVILGFFSSENSVTNMVKDTMAMEKQYQGK